VVYLGESYIHDKWGVAYHGVHHVKGTMRIWGRGDDRTTACSVGGGMTE
jgi:hypothetical protein